MQDVFCIFAKVPVLKLVGNKNSRSKSASKLSNNQDGNKESQC
jgi:hypothetical protein